MLNYLRVTIRKVKVIRENNIQNFNLKLDLSKQAHEIEKLSLGENEINKSFFWDISKILKQDCLELTAISQTLYFFDFIIGKIIIPINISKLNDASEWYYLKNNKNENVIGVLISMFNDSKDKPGFQLFTNNENSFIASKNNFNKNDISCDIIRSNNQNMNNLFLNIINRTKNVGIVDTSVDNININAQSQLIDNKRKFGKNKSNLKLDTTMTCNDNLKSPDISLTNNLFSPFSSRFQNEKNNFNLSNINAKINNNDHFTNSIDDNHLHHSQNNLINKKKINKHIEFSYNDFSNPRNEREFENENFFDLIEKKLELYATNKDNKDINMDTSTINRSYNDANNNANSTSIEKEELKYIFSQLKNKNKHLKEENEKIRRAKEELKKQKERLKNNEAIILREKLKLENEIKNFKQNKLELDNKQTLLTQQINKNNNDMNKLNLDKEVFEFEKNTFFKINFMINTGKNIENFEHTRINDLRDLRKKLSINNLSIPTTNFTGNSSGSFTSKIIAKGNSQKTSMDIKKEISIENSILKIKRDNSADLAIRSNKNQISNGDENLLQSSSNNIINNYGSNSVNKNNNIHDQNSFYAKFNNNNLNSKNNRSNNLLTLQDLVNSPKEEYDTQKPKMIFTNTSIRKFNLSNSSLKEAQNNLYSGAYTTKNQGSMNKLIMENYENAHQELIENNTETDVNTISNFNITSTSNVTSSHLRNNLNMSNQTGNKFYTPIAQIDLNRKKNNHSKMNKLSPKGDKIENKIVDSIENAADLTSHNKLNIILLADKKSNFKFKRAGSDDKPKNLNETKRISNFRGNTAGTGAATAASLNINNVFKDKDRKNISKPSLDRNFKSNKDLNNITSNTSSKINVLKLDATSNKLNSRVAKKIK